MYSLVAAEVAAAQVADAELTAWAEADAAARAADEGARARHAAEEAEAEGRARARLPAVEAAPVSSVGGVRRPVRTLRNSPGAYSLQIIRYCPPPKAPLDTL